MEDSSWGYSEVPPGGGNAAERERRRLAREQEANYPPAERPVYAPLPEPPRVEEEHEPKSGTALSLTSLIIGIAAVVLAAVFFYRSNVNIKSAEIHAQQALTAVDELKHGGATPAALKIELMRTTRTLDAMTVEFAGEPEQLAKIEELRAEVNGILAMLEEKAPGDAAAAGEPAAAETPAPAAAPAAPSPPPASPAMTAPAAPPAAPPAASPNNQAATPPPAH